MSQKKGGILEQAAILASAGIIVRIIGFIYRIPLTNLLGDSGNAIYSMGYYIYTFFLIMSSAGLPAAIAKMVSERVALKQFGNAYDVFKVSLIVAGILGFVASLALGLGARGLARAVGNVDSYLSVLTLAPTVFLVALMAVFRGYYQGMNNTVPTAISQIVEQIFNAFFSVVLAYVLFRETADVKYKVIYAAAGGTTGTSIGAIAGLITIIIIYYMLKPSYLKQIRKYKKYYQKEDSYKIAKELIYTAFPIIIGTAIFSITNFIDMKMIYTLLANANFTKETIDILYGQLTGKYVTLTTLPVSISTAVATAVVPNIASAIATGNKKVANERINTALKLTMVISIPASIGIGVLGGPILQLLFPRHPNGGLLMQVGAVSIIFLSLAQITTGMLQGSGHIKVPAMAAFCGAIFKVIFNFILISNPKINILGAVISTTVCYIVASGIDLYVLKKIMGPNSNLDLKDSFLKPLIASLIMGAVCYVFYSFMYFSLGSLLPETADNISNAIACILSIFIGVIVYFIYMILIKGITRKDISLLPKGERIEAILTRFNIRIG